MSKNSSEATSPDELILGFKNIFFKLYGVYPKVSYPAVKLKAPLSLIQLAGIFEELTARDTRIPYKYHVKDRTKHKLVRMYKYAIIKEACDTGYSYRSVYEFFRVSRTAPNYIAKVIDIAKGNKDPESVIFTSIVERVREAVIKLKNGDI